MSSVDRGFALEEFRRYFGVPESSILAQMAEHGRLLMRADAAIWAVLGDDGLEWHGAVRCEAPTGLSRTAHLFAREGIEAGRPLFIDDDSESSAPRADMDAWGWRSAATMPMVVRGVTVAVLVVGRISGIPWAERERAALVNWMTIEAIRGERRAPFARARSSGETGAAGLVFERAPIAMALLDGEGRFLRVNEAFSFLVGRSADELIGTEGRRWVRPVEGDPTWDYFEQMLAGRRRGYTVERRIKLPDASERRVRVMAAQLRLERGGHNAHLLILEDISAVGETERSLQVREERLRTAQRRDALSQLAGGIAHEFNNALAAIAGLASLLRDDLEVSDARRGDAEDILRVTQEASDLTRRLLDLSADRLSERATFDLREVMRAFTAVARRVLPSTIEWQLDLPADPVTASIDRVQIEQVLLGLVINARDAMPNGGVVRVTVERVRAPGGDADSRDVARIAVADTGPGIPEDMVERLWTPFFSTKPSGAGLGLSLGAAVMQEHNGELRLESRPGESALFALYLPLASVAAEVTPGGTPMHIERGVESRAILLAEDERLVRTTQSRLLERAGFQVTVASDGEEAWRLFEQGPDVFDAVITDLQMPRLAGAELIARIRRLRPHLPVIVTSAHPADPKDTHDLRADHMARLRKPYTFATLRATLEDLLADD